MLSSLFLLKLKELIFFFFFFFWVRSLLKYFSVTLQLEIWLFKIILRTVCKLCCRTPSSSSSPVHSLSRCGFWRIWNLFKWTAPMVNTHTLFWGTKIVERKGWLLKELLSFSSLPLFPLLQRVSPSLSQRLTATWTSLVVWLMRTWMTQRCSVRSWWVLS